MRVESVYDRSFFQVIFQVFLCNCLVALKNCEDHTRSSRSAVLIHEIHVLTLSIYIYIYRESC